MSHELRSPMNAIIGFADAMRREIFGRVQPPKYREYAADIHSSSVHLLSVINDILDLTKATAGKLSVHESLIAVDSIADAVVRLVDLRADAACVALKTEVPADLPPLSADGRMVRQMLLNLLTNAIKYTPSGGTVRLAAALGADGAMRIAVTDTGIGIAAEDVPRILEPYGRINSPRTRATEGTGLGLPLVNAMMQAHGGALEIESRPGTGSTFTLRFPANRTALAEAA